MKDILICNFIVVKKRFEWLQVIQYYTNTEGYIKSIWGEIKVS